MRKVLSTTIIIALLMSIPTFTLDTINADTSQNTITVPNKIKAGKKITFTANGYKQNIAGITDGEIRYIPDSYELNGPGNYYLYDFYANSPYKTTKTLKKPGKYIITVEFEKQIYNQSMNEWVSSFQYSKTSKTVTVTKPIYKITLNANKGKINKKNKIKKTVTYWNKYGKLKTPQKSGYTFKGWYTQKNGGKKVTKATKVTKLKKHTLYAHWKKNAVKSKSKSSTKTKSKIVYITNTGTKYHRSACRYLHSSKIKISLSKAKDQGYSACSVCKP